MLPIRRPRPLLRGYVFADHIALQCDTIDLRPFLESLQLHLSNHATWASVGAIVRKWRPLLCSNLLTFESYGSEN